jgi:hypothetical protein
MTNVNDNVRISDNIGVVASSSSKQLSSIRTLSLPFFILNILLKRAGIIVRRAAARIASLSAQPDQIPFQCDIYKIVEEKHFEQFL